MSGDKDQEWKYLGTGKVIAEDRQVATVAQDGEIFESKTHIKVKKANGRTRIFNKSVVQDIKV